VATTPSDDGLRYTTTASLPKLERSDKGSQIRDPIEGTTPRFGFLLRAGAWPVSGWRSCGAAATRHGGAVGRDRLGAWRRRLPHLPRRADPSPALSGWLSGISSRHAPLPQPLLHASGRGARSGVRPRCRSACLAVWCGELGVRAFCARDRARICAGHVVRSAAAHAKRTALD
jgi:hypothetical protein